KDAELKKLHDRLKVAISLVQESSKSFAGETPALPGREASLKLSEQRREKLLAHFKTVAPAQLSQKRQRRFHWLEMAAVLAIVAILAGLLLPTLAKSKNR